MLRFLNRSFGVDCPTTTLTIVKGFTKLPTPFDSNAASEYAKLALNWFEMCFFWLMKLKHTHRIPPCTLYKRQVRSCVTLIVVVRRAWAPHPRTVTAPRRRTGAIITLVCAPHWRAHMRDWECVSTCLVVERAQSSCVCACVSRLLGDGDRGQFGAHTYVGRNRVARARRKCA